MALGILALFTPARFSEAFLVLHAEGTGLPIAFVPLVLVAMNVVPSPGAYPLGALADRMDRRRPLAAGAALLVAADLVLAFAPCWPVVFLGAALWGLPMAATKGLLSAVVADAAPAGLRGSAFGLFNLAQGVALVLASTGARLPWDMAGPEVTFLARGAVALAAAAGLLMLPGRASPPSAGTSTAAAA